MTFESRKSGKVRNRSELLKSIKMLQHYNAKYREEIAELEAKLDAVTEGLALLADGSTPWMLWRKGEGPGEGRSVWEAMAEYAKQLLSAAIGEQSDE